MALQDTNAGSGKAVSSGSPGPGVWDVAEESDPELSNVWDIAETESKAESAAPHQEAKRPRMSSGPHGSCPKAHGTAHGQETTDAGSTTQQSSTAASFSEPPSVPGTEWWAKIVWNSMAHISQGLPASPTSAFTHEDFCCGTLGIRFGFEARGIEHVQPLLKYLQHMCVQGLTSLRSYDMLILSSGIFALRPQWRACCCCGQENTSANMHLYFTATRCCTGIGHEGRYHRRGGLQRSCTIIRLHELP